MQSIPYTDPHIIALEDLKQAYYKGIKDGERMTDKDCLNRIAKLTDKLDILDVTKEEYLEAIKIASFKDIRDELWEFYCYSCDIKSVLMERRPDHD